jgi:capsid protein
MAALLATQTDLRAKSRDLVRRNAWANAALESFAANAIGTGIKPQSLVADAAQRERIQTLWRDWAEEADAAGLTDLYGLQARTLGSKPGVPIRSGPEALEEAQEDQGQ